MRRTACVGTYQGLSEEYYLSLIAISCCIMDLRSTELKQCPVCKGAGKVVTGYGVICMELVEKVEKCQACGGNGFSAVNNCHDGSSTLSKKLIKVY